MTKIKDLHKTWMKDAAYRKEYDALEEEFTVMAAIAKARRRAGLSQAELARRMKTTQSTVARLESGRGQPSTRTLVRFAKATGHRLKIGFQPMGKGRGRTLPALVCVQQQFEATCHYKRPRKRVWCSTIC